MSNQILTFIADSLDVYKRLDSYLSETDSDYSRSYFSDLIKKGNVSVNGNVINKSSYRINENDKVVVDLPEIET
jgi:23S rRNA pseudouridine1911/1915/1917 synthase